MKKKFIIFTLCFTIIFSSLNYNKSYAYGGVISLPILATVSSLAVATDIVLSGNDDLFDIGRLFYDYVETNNNLTWATIQSVFSSSVSLLPNKLVSVDSPFLNIVKDFFDSLVGDGTASSSTPLGHSLGIALYPGYTVVSNNSFKNTYFNIYLEGNSLKVYYNGLLQQVFSASKFEKVRIRRLDSSSFALWLFIDGRWTTQKIYDSLSLDLSIPYTGGYTWDNVENKKENESVSLPIPGNLGSLVGQNSKDFWDNADNLVGDDPLTYPSIDNPSIDIDGSVSFPSTDLDNGVGNPSVPNEGIFTTIKDFIISLVVPNDTFWTDTWGGLYNNFTDSFPMVDMSGFNDLVTGEKKFPNIDIDIMGITGRVVNGDVINSIVEWLRPIIAGFMMICLMLFNYRKIYKLIRNTEPFGGIAPGTSDFKTGISEYQNYEDYKQSLREYRDFLYNHRGK